MVCFIGKRSFFTVVCIGKRILYQENYYLCTNKKVVKCYTERLQNGLRNISLHFRF